MSELDQVAHVQGLFVQHLPALRGFVLSLAPDFALVDDIVQETFVTVTAKAADFQRGTNFRAWAWAIARFKILQQLQRRAPAAEPLSEEAIEALCAHADARIGFLEEALQHLEPCLGRLTPRARQAIELRYHQAHRPPEIARRMGWTVEAVHVALTRARIALRECVNQRLAADPR